MSICGSDRNKAVGIKSNLLILVRFWKSAQICSGKCSTRLRTHANMGDLQLYLFQPFVFRSHFEAKYFVEKYVPTSASRLRDMRFAARSATLLPTSKKGVMALWSR